MGRGLARRSAPTGSRPCSRAGSRPKDTRRGRLRPLRLALDRRSSRPGPGGRTRCRRRPEGRAGRSAGSKARTCFPSRCERCGDSRSGGFANLRQSKGQAPGGPAPSEFPESSLAASARRRGAPRQSSVSPSKPVSLLYGALARADCCVKLSLTQVHVKLALHRHAKPDPGAARRSRGLSQQQLAEAMAVSRQTINSIETERYTPSLPLALALARFFGRPVEEIFDGNDADE